MRRTVALALVGFAVLGAPEARAQTGGAVAIVVNPSTSVDDLSLLELRNVFLGDRQFWGDGSRIVLLVRAPVAYERDVVLNRIYRMDESQFRQYWIAKVFRAQVSSGPKIVYSNDMTRQLVAALPGAVGFIPASDVAADMKVLRINGKLPGDPDYPLR
jgi:ABC-type phosphate transport system substrate-binding protein